MAADHVRTLRSFVKGSDSLTILAEAMGEERLHHADRVLAAADSRSPQEGLALLAAYVAIPDQAARQAILDVVATISARLTR